MDEEQKVQTKPNYFGLLLILFKTYSEKNIMCDETFFKKECK